MTWILFQAFQAIDVPVSPHDNQEIAVLDREVGFGDDGDGVRENVPDGHDMAVTSALLPTGAMAARFANSPGFVIFDTIYGDPVIGYSISRESSMDMSFQTRRDRTPFLV